MNKKEFMNQPASDMSVSELAQAIKIKEKENLNRNLDGLSLKDLFEPTYDFKVGDQVELIEEKRDVAHWYNEKWTNTYCCIEGEKYQIQDITKDGKLELEDFTKNNYYNPACFKKIEKITSLKDLEYWDFIEFTDGTIGKVSSAGGVNGDCSEYDKCIMLLKDDNDLIWGCVAGLYFNDFKAGNYKRIFKGKIEIKEE